MSTDQPAPAPVHQIRRMRPTRGPLGAVLDLLRGLLITRRQLSVPMQEKRDLPAQLADARARGLQRQLDDVAAGERAWRRYGLDVSTAASALLAALDGGPDTPEVHLAVARLRAACAQPWPGSTVAAAPPTTTEQPAASPKLVVVGCPQCQEPMRADADACRVCGWKRPGR